MRNSDRLSRRGEAPLLGIVLPVRNRRQATLRALESLYAVDYPSAIVHVVDDGSTDLTSTAVSELYPEICVTRHGTPLGLPRATAHGMKQAFSQGADAVFVFDDSLTLDENLLTRLVDAALAYPNAGILGPRIEAPGRPGPPWSTGYRLNGRPWRIPGPGRGGHVEAACPAPVDYVRGCAMLVTRRMHEAAPYPVAYHDVGADLDYCLTAKRHGFDVLYIPHAKMWRDAESGRGNPSDHRHRRDRSDHGDRDDRGDRGDRRERGDRGDRRRDRASDGITGRGGSPVARARRFRDAFELGRRHVRGLAFLAHTTASLLRAVAPDFTGSRLFRRGADAAPDGRPLDDRSSRSRPIHEREGVPR